MRNIYKAFKLGYNVKYTIFRNTINLEYGLNIGSYNIILYVYGVHVKHRCALYVCYNGSMYNHWHNQINEMIYHPQSDISILFYQYYGV